MKKYKSPFVVDALHIFALCSLAFAQPLFDLLSRHAEFFVVRKSAPMEIMLLVLFLSLLLPMTIILLEVIAGMLGEKVRFWLHRVLVATLVACVVLPPLKRLGEGLDTSLVIAALALGTAFSIVTVRYHSIRLFLTILSPVALIFPSLFLLHSPVRKVIFSEKSVSTPDAIVSSSTPVVMVVFDELPITSLMDERLRVDPIRYPHFASLARNSTWFRNTTTVAWSTEICVPVILTGNYPDRWCLPTATEYPHNLFTLLGDAYDLKVFEPRTQLCPDQLRVLDTEQSSLAVRMVSLLSDLTIVYGHLLLPGGMTANLPPVTQNWMDFAANWNAAGPESTDRPAFELPIELYTGDRPEIFARFVELVEESSEPALYFLHSLLPHGPMIYLPSGKTYSTVPGLAGMEESGRWADDDRAVHQAYQRHLLQVGFADHLLGSLVARLNKVGLYDRSLIVVTADHGASFRPGDERRRLTETNFPDILPVPLFIKKPFQKEGRISDRNVETIDILPTIADVLGIALPWPVHGCSVRDQSNPERALKTAFTNVQYGREPVKLTFPSDVVIWDSALERKLSLFGSGSKPHGLFRIGPHDSLVGKHIKDLDIRERTDLSAVIDQGSLAEDVDPSDVFVPAHITGRLIGDNGEPTDLDLAIAVNGTIQAVARTYYGQGTDGRFSTIVPGAAFREGRNEVEVIVVESESGTISHLVRTSSGQDLRYSLAISNSEVELFSSDGTRTRVTPGAIEGWVNSKPVGDRHVQFSGWAFDTSHSIPSVAILVAFEGEIIYQGNPNRSRPDLVKKYGSAAANCGFSFVLPKEIFGALGKNAQIRIFAISNRAASELRNDTAHRWNPSSGSQ